MVNLKKLFNQKWTQIILLSIGLNIALMYTTFKKIDPSAWLVVFIIGLIIATTFGSPKMKPVDYLLAGAFIMIIYNGGGFLLNGFSDTITMTIIAVSAIQQGIITYITAILWGVK